MTHLDPNPSDPDDAQAPPQEDRTEPQDTAPGAPQDPPARESTPQDDIERDAIVLPEYEQRLAAAQASGDTDAIADITGEYTDARGERLQRQRERAQEDDS